MNAVKQYLAAIGRKGGKKSRRKLTKAQALAMVRARTAKRAALRPNAPDQPRLAGSEQPNETKPNKL